MKIAESNVCSRSSRTYQSVSEKTQSEALIRNNSASGDDRQDIASTLTLSSKSISLLRERLRELKQQTQDHTAKKADRTSYPSVGRFSDTDVRLETLKKILSEMSKWRYGKRIKEDKKHSTGDTASQPVSHQKLTAPTDLQGMSPFSTITNMTPFSISPKNATFLREVTTSSFFHEEECTTFSTMGTVVTESGREINFNLSLEMSRSFTAEHSEVVTSFANMTDPLVINLGFEATTVSDMKFRFDIDADGTEDTISELGNGSGFLALDKNGDNVINNGSELFGAKTGDGFAELSVYDDDGNGWIDENDTVFHDLKIWTKNENGENELISLKKSGVGAIYLGAADTKFSLNRQSDNKTNAMIQKTGFYLKENGGVGTIQHVDFAT